MAVPRKLPAPGASSEQSKPEDGCQNISRWVRPALPPPGKAAAASAVSLEDSLAHVKGCDTPDCMRCLYLRNKDAWASGLDSE